MKRRGFNRHQLFATPYIPRRGAEQACVTHMLQRQSGAAVFASEPYGGVTRFLEKVHSWIPKDGRFRGKWVRLLVDLTNRSRWEMLDYLVDLRNQLVSHYGACHPKSYTERHFVPFDFLAASYWIIFLNCEPDSLHFDISPIAKKSAKLGGAACKVFVPLLELSEMIGATADQAVQGQLNGGQKKRIIRWIKDKLVKLGTGPAARVRAEMSAGQNVNESDFFNATVEEFIQSTKRLALSYPDTKVALFVDATDILEEEAEFDDQCRFSTRCLSLIAEITDINTTRTILGMRQLKESTQLHKDICARSWKVNHMSPIPLGDLKRVISTDNLSLDPTRIEDLIAASTCNKLNEHVDLTRFASAWAKHQEELGG